VDRRAFVKTAGLAVPASLVGAPAIAQSSPAIRWRCQSSFDRSLDTLFGAAELFAARVLAASDGNFRIDLVPAGPDQFVPGPEIFDATSEGAIEMCQTASYYFVAKDPVFAFGTAIPFGFNARHFNAWMMQGGGNELLNAFYGKYGIYGLLGGNSGAQMGGWFRNEILSVDDLKGLRMRISGLAGMVMKKLGVDTRQVPASDAVRALAAGEIDAAEWVGPYDDEKLGFAKAAAFYYYPGFWEGAGGIHYFINAAKWAELPAAYKAIVTAAAAETNGWMLSKYDSANAIAYKRLVDQGVQVRPFTRDILDAAYQAARETYREISAENPTFAAIYDHMNTFRRRILPWFGVCEYPFDSYIYLTMGRG